MGGGTCSAVRRDSVILFWTKIISCEGSPGMGDQIPILITISDPLPPSTGNGCIRYCDQIIEFMLFTMQNSIHRLKTRGS
jgi:hypothetical protein